MKNWEGKLKIYDQFIATNSNFKRKGKTVPYTSANGYMFSLLNKDGEIGIRLSKDDQRAFIEKYNSGPYFSHGATMKDYVVIPEVLYTEIDLLAPYLEKSFQFVMTLKPK